MMVIDFFAGMIIAILAGMGVGGGGLLVLYLVYVRNVEQIAAQGLNLVFFVFAALASMVYHMKRRKIDYKLCMWLIIFGGVGAVIGSFAANVISKTVVRRIFGWLLVTSGALSLIKRKKE